MPNPCFGCWGNCPKQVPDGVGESSLYWKIDCPTKDGCYLNWERSGKKTIDDAIKLLEEHGI